MLVKRIAAYPSIFNRLRAIARSEIATFFYPLHLTPRWDVPIGIPGKRLVLKKLESSITWNYQEVKTV